MSRGDSLARQLKLMTILEDRRVVAVPEVAEELGYTPRTVYRDLTVLERVGVPIYQERQGRRARWRVVEGYRRKLSLTLSWPEVLGLLAGQQFMSGTGSSLLRDGAESALEKIAAALPPELMRRAESVGAKLSAHAGIESDDGASADGASRERFQRIADAVDRQETLRLVYRKHGGARAQERLVDPYLIHLQGGALYLIGFCHRRRKLRTFLLARVRAAEPTGKLFHERVAFSRSALLQGGFGPWEGKAQRVSVRFNRDVAAIVAERKLHSSQQGQWRSDGGLDVELSVPICPAVVSWVLGWGASAEVLAPEPLKARVRVAHARAAVRSH